jgi:hypothetical protein
MLQNNVVLWRTNYTVSKVASCSAERLGLDSLLEGGGLC